MTFQKKYAIILKHVGVWLSLVERLVRDQEVGCSSHLTPTTKSTCNLQVLFYIRFSRADEKSS